MRGHVIRHSTVLLRIKWVRTFNQKMMEDRILPASPAAQLNAGNRLSGGLLQQSDEYAHFNSPVQRNARKNNSGESAAGIIGAAPTIQVTGAGLITPETEAAATGERFIEILMVITASFMVNLIKRTLRIAPCFLCG